MVELLPAPSFFTTSGVPDEAAPGSELTTWDSDARLTLASASNLVIVTEWVRGVKAYELPLDITIEHTMPPLDTRSTHAYNFALITEEGNSFFIIHYLNNLNNPNPYIEAGIMKAGEWTPLWSEARQPPEGNIEWRILLDSSTFTLYENDEQLYQVPNELAETSFYLHFSHDTSDTTLKTWTVNAVEFKGEKIQ